MKNSVNKLASRIDAIYNGEVWFGESLLTKLQNVTEAAAFQQPIKGKHCIAQILSHMEYWRRSFIYRLRGDKSIAFSYESSENWKDPASLKREGWSNIKGSFERTHKQLIDELNKATAVDPELEADLNGLTDHDIYHLGQIGLVKSFIS